MCIRDRAIRASLDAVRTKENQVLGAKLGVLSNAIAGGPYIGLLGTVLGIMVVFLGTEMCIRDRRQMSYLYPSRLGVTAAGGNIIRERCIRDRRHPGRGQRRARRRRDARAL